jgi:mono/diheme cytochrome c family protein
MKLLTSQLSAKTFPLLLKRTSQLRAKTFPLLQKAIILLVPVVMLAGCQQHMAEQPAPRTYEPLNKKTATGDKADVANVYTASWKLPEAGTVARGQRSAIDPMVTGLTELGRKPRPAYSKEYLAKIPAERVKLLEDAVTQPGAPDNLDHFVKAFPWKMTSDDLMKGQIRYNVECAVCHGAAGNGKGKIAERGTLWPPTYHRDPDGTVIDTYGFNPTDPGAEKVDRANVLKQGHSRGFHRFGVTVALDEVPVGYIFEVITRGYGSMPYLRDKVSPEDRWRIVAYVRALQFSQGAKFADLPAEVKKEFEDATSGKKPLTKVDGHGPHAEDAKKGGH